ncbi:coiled-coil domain-containing protein 60-like [Polymixia lowei]
MWRQTYCTKYNDVQGLSVHSTAGLLGPRPPQTAAWRPYEEPDRPLRLEPRRLTLETVGQCVEETVPICCTQAGKRQDSMSLRRHLGHARRLVSAVKRGQGYFHLLQKEEREEEEEEEERQRRTGEDRRRAEPRPPCFSSDSDSDSDRWPLAAGSSQSREKKAQSARPFTPLHRSLTSPLLGEAPRDAVYRQLCCLNWLLEALTLERSGRAGPLISCWDQKDPGRGRTAPRTLSKDRAIETKWEQFVSATKPRRTGPKPPRGSSDRLYLLRKSSALSVASSSAIASPTLGGSLSSLGPGAEEETARGPIKIATAASGVNSQDTAPPGGEEESEPPTSEYLRTLLDAVHQSVKKELYGQSPSTTSMTDSLTASRSRPQPLPQRTDKTTASKMADGSRPKSCPAKPLSAASQLIDSKASMLEERRAAFEERAGEMAQSYADILEHNARKRLNSGLEKYRALHHMTGSSCLPRHVTRPSATKAKPPETGATGRTAASQNNNNKRSNNMWLSVLLSSLPVEVCRDGAVSRVLEKLSGFADERTPRIRPHLFLKVLGGLQPWELCLPDLCVAIEPGSMWSRCPGRSTMPGCAPGSPCPRGNPSYLPAHQGNHA